jgi:ABC-type Zn uptake system ZnuABC Zn-binding protein ZnuA
MNKSDIVKFIDICEKENLIAEEKNRLNCICLPEIKDVYKKYQQMYREHNPHYWTEFRIDVSSIDNIQKESDYFDICLFGLDYDMTDYQHINYSPEPIIQQRLFNEFAKELDRIDEEKKTEEKEKLKREIELNQKRLNELK